MTVHETGGTPATPNRTPIHQRPTKAHLRSQFGHWEGDLMHFRRQRDILLTRQERRSRLTLATRLLSKDSELTASSIAAELGGLPPRARRTITHDNSGEFARHQAVSEKIGLEAFGMALGPMARSCLTLRPAQPLATRRHRERQWPPRSTSHATRGSATTPTMTSTTSSGTSTQRRENAMGIGPRSRPLRQTSVSHLKRESSMSVPANCEV